MSVLAQKGQLKTNLHVNPKKYMKFQHIAAGPYVRSTSDLCRRPLNKGDQLTRLRKIFELEN